ncbi:MAG: galactokinase [Alphaproteobacteria bacterium]|nr:galactokinase [Alphaproteobacteria bacterium]HPF46185.1 galactokinase [Emcibacteraceae bacterium]HRW30478.1 galactokinase [Emcibacteraceae bacterium]
MSKDHLIEKVLSAHQKNHGQGKTVVILAPGRVNLIGEHTDYNNGFVLPASINFFTCVAGSLNDKNQVSVTALDFDGDVDHFDLKKDIVPTDEQWKNYIRGAFYMLKSMGYSLKGCDLTISGTIPKGAGLSSSASLEVAVLNTLCDLNNIQLSQVEISQIGQQIECDFVGLSCGIMDQLSTACGEESCALLIDCLDHQISHVPIPPSLALMIINSNVKRELSTSGYNDRRKSCELVANKFGVNSLRDLSLDIFLMKKNELPSDASKRAEHVFRENERVLKMVDALKKNDIPLISKLMAESHLSMKDLYEITTPEIDYLVDIISNEIGDKGGVRMTGGGFGGCVIALIPKNLTDKVKKAVNQQYHVKTGLKEDIYICEPACGEKLIG